ncbi:hypothetical protein [Cohnella thermotolerans]|uniref:hypothetical protein n=1 Tax=Cohnella thermotolerans TaxID=329858 RepID=UPI000426E4B5|nr:hypothetical protein [Cohnella thermotolerans]
MRGFEALSLGTSQHPDTFVSYKRNQGVGEQNGDISPMFVPISLVLDCDLVDSPGIKGSLLWRRTHWRRLEPASIYFYQATAERMANRV